MAEETALSLNNDKVLSEIHEAAKIIRKGIMEQKTPSEYQRSKPIGSRTVTYVPASYMDNKFKENIPLYKNEFSFPPFVFQNWIIVGVQVTDRTTQNTELGLKAHRIQFSAAKKQAVQAGTIGVQDLTPFDMIDVGNDVSAALTEAIKNAQSRFGIAADVYEKLIISPEDSQKAEDSFLTYLNSISSPLQKSKLKAQWTSLKPIDKINFIEELNNEQT